MSVALFLTWPAAPGAPSDADLAKVQALVAGIAGLSEALAYTPEKADDPYLKREATPPLALQLYFEDIDALEHAAAPGGTLQALVAPGAAPSLGGTIPEHQAMLVRRYAVPEPAMRTPAGALPCTYLVGYEGPADDLNAWLAHYIGRHPPIMARFPGIRATEVCTRIDWIGFLPGARDRCMLRNKVVFDSAAALGAALASPVRHEMRADYAAFPPFRGAVFHYPMATRRLATP